MKPTPPTGRSWASVVLILSGITLLLWGCGHAREIVYPNRKIDPPRTIGPQPFRSSAKSTSRKAIGRPLVRSERPADAPASIDVPLLDRNGP